MGQIYVLISRCTDPMNFILCGVPPKDLIEELSQALIAAGVNVDQYFKTACSVTTEWVYDESFGRVKDRFRLKFDSERGIPLKNRTLAEVLCPQPAASVVIKKLLDWIDRVDRRTCAAKPAFETEDGQTIFPENEEPWWLTEVQRRIPEEEHVEGDEDGPASEEEQQVEVSDEDPLSDEADEHTVVHKPKIAWRKS